MSTEEVIQQIEHVSNAERLALIEVATRLVRENLPLSSGSERDSQEQRMREAASRVQDL